MLCHWMSCVMVFQEQLIYLNTIELHLSGSPIIRFGLAHSVYFCREFYKKKKNLFETISYRNQYGTGVWLLELHIRRRRKVRRRYIL
jgi:hypothetical protein